MVMWRPADRIVEASDPSGPAVVSVSDMKVHLRVDHNEEDALIEGLLLAAEGHVERHLQRYLRPRNVVLRLSSLPSGRVPVALPGGRVTALASVEIDGVGFAGCSVFGESPARLVPSGDWPRPVGEVYPVTVTYSAGYAAAPSDLVVAVKMLAAEMYERRENGSADSITAVPVGADMLMQPHRIWPF